MIVSVAGALITGLTAAAIAFFNVRSQRAEQWRARRLEAASDFSKRFVGGVDSVAYALAHPEDRAAADNALHLAGEVTPLLGPLSLVFGFESAADRAARSAHDDLRRAAEAAKRGDENAGRVALADASAHRSAFEAAVRAAVA